MPYFVVWHSALRPGNGFLQVALKGRVTEALARRESFVATMRDHRGVSSIMTMPRCSC